MKRWDDNKDDYVEDPKVDAFIEAVLELSRKHGYSIGHQDHHGAFIIEPFDDNNAKWLCNAHIDIKNTGQ